MRVHRALIVAAVLVAVAPATAEAAAFPAPLACLSQSGSSGCGTAPLTEDLHQVVVSPDGAFVFGVVRGADALVSFARGADGRLTFVSCVGSGGGCPPPARGAALYGVREIALSPDGKDLYAILGEEETAISQFWVGANGSLTYASCNGLPAGCGAAGFTRYSWPADVEVSPDGRDVYVLRRRRAPLRARRAGRPHVPRLRGRAGLRRRVRAPPEPHAMAISPDGRNIYATSGDTNVFRESRVVHFRRDPATGSRSRTRAASARTSWGGTGACAPLPAGVVSTSGAVAIVVSPDSGHVYTAGWTASVNEFEGIAAVTHFTRRARTARLRFADCIGNQTSGCTGLRTASSSSSRVAGRAPERAGPVRDRDRHDRSPLRAGREAR